MTERWHVSVDARVCMSTGTCLGTAPGRFVFDADERSSPVDEVIDADEAVRDAAASCPVEAITVTHADTGEPVDLG
jgi:ferredoxin